MPARRRTPLAPLLLVEDDEGDAFLVSELLLEAGIDWPVEWVRSLSDAAAALTSGVRCVLLDLGLPDADDNPDGLGALHDLLAIDPSVPVLVLTGLDDEARGAAAVFAGAQDYLVKGQVDGHSLARAVLYAVERRRAEESNRQLIEARLLQRENDRLTRGLLPQPQLLSPDLSVQQEYRPGERRLVLGGDFYDVIESVDGRLHLLVGDVSGHGPDEAALGVHLRVAWRTLVLAGVPPEAVLPILEDILVRERRSDEIFATVCQLVIGRRSVHRNAVARRASGADPARAAMRAPRGRGSRRAAARRRPRVRLGARRDGAAATVGAGAAHRRAVRGLRRIAHRRRKVSSRRGWA